MTVPIRRFRLRDAQPGALVGHSLALSAHDITDIGLVTSEVKVISVRARGAKYMYSFNVFWARGPCIDTIAYTDDGPNHVLKTYFLLVPASEATAS